MNFIERTQAMKALTLYFTALLLLLTLNSNPVFCEPFNMELVGQLDYDNLHRADAVAYKDGFAYVTLGGDELRTYDLRDPQRMTLVSKVHFELGDSPFLREMAIVGDYLLLNTYINPTGMIFMDISDPASPDSVGFFNMDPNHNISYYHLLGAADTLLMFSNDYTTLLIYDLTENFNLELLSRTEFPGIVEAFSHRGTQLAVSCVDWHGYENIDQGLQLVDMSNPRNLELGRWFPTGGDYNGGGFYRSYLGDNFIVIYERYQVSWDNYVNRFNFLDLTEGQEIRSRLQRGATFRDPKIYGEGDRVWLPSDSGIVVYDVSNVLRPTLETTIRLQPDNRTIYREILSLQNDALVMAHSDWYDYPARRGFTIHDVSNPDSAVMLGIYRTFNQSARQVAVHENLAAVIFESWIQIVEISDPETPTEIFSWSVPGLEGVMFNSNGELIVYSRQVGLTGYTLNADGSPQDSSRGGITFPWSIRFGTDHVFASGIDRVANRTGVFIYDVSDALHMRESGFFACNHLTDLVQVGPRLYGANYRTVVTVDISNLEQPRQINVSNFYNRFYPLAGFGFNLLGYEPTNLNGENWIVQAETMPGDSLVKIPHVGFMSPTNRFTGITMLPGGEAFLMPDRAGVGEYSITWGRRPRLIRYFDTPGDALSVAYSREDDDPQYVYVADGSDFLILERTEELDIQGDDRLIPGSLSLAVSPNPFNGIAKLRYTLPASSPIRLTIFDTAGREIASLITSEQPAGTHNVTWNADGVGTGLYFAMLVSGEEELVQKLVLVK
jgi:hypothetical protein